jgi:uncharacterized protein (UPF0548 family)
VLLLRRPTPGQLERFAADARSESLTYAAVGATLTGSGPSGYHYAEHETALGSGAEVFERARQALQEWRAHRGADLEVFADGPIAVGTTVAVAAPLPLGCAVATCRIVAVVDEHDRFGFAYGTLPNHPESGEEMFLIERRGDGSVVFRIVVFSRPHELLVRLGSPVAKFMQRRATSAYLAAMRAAV